MLVLQGNSYKLKQVLVKFQTGLRVQFVLHWQHEEMYDLKQWLPKCGAGTTVGPLSSQHQMGLNFYISSRVGITVFNIKDSAIVLSTVK